MTSSPTPTSAPSRDPGRAWQRRRGMSVLVLAVVFLAILGVLQFATHRFTQENRRSLRRLQASLRGVRAGSRILERALGSPELKAAFEDPSSQGEWAEAFCEATVSGGRVFLPGPARTLPPPLFQDQVPPNGELAPIVVLPLSYRPSDPDHQGKLALRTRLSLPMAGEWVDLALRLDARFRLIDRAGSLSFEPIPESASLRWRRIDG